MQPISKTNTLLITAICFLAFFLFGITDNLKGPTLPAMMAEMNINYGASGNIFSGEYLGFLFATLITGILADRYGLKPVIVLAGVLLAIGVGGYSSFNTPALLTISLFIVGLGLGAFELGPNAVIVSLYKEQKGLYLNLMAVMHGLGSMIAPLFASFLFGLQATWRGIYRWDLLFILVFILIAITLRFPKTEEKNALNFRAIPSVAFKHHLPYYYGAMLFYVAAEIGLVSWMIAYLQDAHGIQGSNYLALFFGLMMLGRFLGSFVVNRLGYLRAVLTAALFALISLSIGIFTPLTIFISITGFFFSIIFPTLTAAVSDAEHENINTVLGVLFTFSGLGGLIGPWAIAWGSDFFGLQTGISITILLTGLTALFTFVLYYRSRYGQNT